ncbi:MAG: polysaccharide biosynthesis tyrosine autokinase [Hassallia sp. WJT32-NPBG1]|nr:polysaccharide biosynthesis tyrosine autokinase [Hassallia sp. WJT32-NPBG1]
MPIKEEDLQGLNNSNSLSRESYGFRKKPEGNENNQGLSQIFTVLRRRVAVIASVAVIVTTGTIGWSATRIPKYEGKFQLLVEPLKTSDNELLILLSQTLQQNVNEISRQNTTALDYQALMEVLKSPKLINPVIQELQKQYPEISYDRLVGNDVSGKLASGREGTLYVTRLAKGKDESRIIEVRYRDSDPQKIQIVLDRVSQAYRKYSQQQQQTNLRQGIKFVDEQLPKLRYRVNALQGQLQFFQQQHDLFNPQLQGEQLLKRRDELQATKLETEKKLAEAKSLYLSLQGQLGMPQNEAIAASALSESPQYQQLLNRIRDIEAKIATESVRFKDESPTIRLLRDQRDKLIPLLNKEAQLTLGNNAPDVKLNSSQLGGFQNSVRRELIQQLANNTNQVKSLEASLSATNAAQVKLNEQLLEYPVISRQYANIQRELQAAADTLNQLLNRQEALRVDAAQQEVPWELIMPPTLPRNKTGQLMPVSPSGTSNILLGGVAGILLGVLVAFVLDNLENVYHDGEEIKQTTQLPLLGVIPFHKELKKLARAGDVVQLTKKHNPEREDNHAKSIQHRSAQFLEAICSFYTKVQSYKLEASTRSIAITSATSGEGKTTLAAYLAQMAAEAGARVLLVDGDLRHPQIHLRFGLLNNQGLSEVLSEGIDISKVIQQSPSDDNLFILTGGRIPANPTKLLSSLRMQTFIDKSQTSYDLVVYDTPHLLGRLDTNVLLSQVDGIVLVTGLGKALRPTLKQALSELKSSRVPILGTVANTVEH